MTRVLALVCANGLGHFRRTIGILDRLIARAPGLEITVACEPWQREKTRGWAAGDRVFSLARTLDGVIQPGVQWARGPATYADDRLLAWEARLSARPEVRAAELVLSDNLGGALALRPDAVLAGSFLWSDLLAHAYGDDPNVARFVAHEHALLEATRPPMLCVDALAMPGVRARTSAVALPWMTEELLAPRSAPASKPRVLFAGGATGAADDLLSRAAAHLERALGDAISVVRGGFEGELELASADLVICRPGVGTLTGCIAARVPMVLVHEGNNLELAHNAACIEGRGLGVDAGAEASPAAVEDAVRALLDPSRWARTVEAIAAEPTGGLEAAAAWLADRIGMS